MLIKIHKNRSVSSSGTWGTKNENNYEILNFEFPKELEEYNKRIVYYLGNQKVWDPIIDNKAILTNAITTKGSVKAYIWCTKSDEAFETDVDFRTQLFEMNFFENENADGIVPTEEQIDGFNTMLTAMNNKIDEVDALETTIETAEAQRQEAEATRVSNENTRESNESTRQTNEQTRQTQEADRERRTDKAIADIEDKTAEYNANAEAKTTAFNNNATQKTNEFNSNYTQKVNDFNANASSKESAFNSNASSKTSAFNSNAETKTNAFNTNATNKTNAFNSNATEKTSAFDNNASSKTSEFNTNAESKTSTFNDNATQKTTNFDNNASEKTDEFNTNAQNKIDEYDEHIVDYQAQIDELQEEVEELSENMPWNTTEQATEISVDDAAKYSRNKLELFGNTEQDNTKMTYKCDGTETGDYYLTYNSIDYYFTMPTITEGDILVFDTTDLKLYLADTEITIESTGTGTNLTFIASPNLDYPQPIHVVSGENTIGVNSKNFYDATQRQQTKNSLTYSADNQYIYLDGKVSSGFNCDFKHFLIPKGTYTMMFELKDGSINTTNDGGLFYVYGSVSTSAQRITNTNKRRAVTFTLNTDGFVYVHVWPRSSETFSNARIAYQLVKENVADYNFVPYYHANYPINLGSIELCKIGDYQDYLYKENGNWYKYGAINNYIITGNENYIISSSYSDETYLCAFVRAGLFAALNDNGFINKFQKGYFTQVRDKECMRINGQIHVRILVSRLNENSVEGLKRYFANLYEQNNPVIVYYIQNTPTSTQIIDETLISQLDEIYEHLKLVKGTNNITITAEDIAPYMKLSYMQDLPSKLDNLDSRLALLE